MHASGRWEAAAAIVAKAACVRPVSPESATRNRLTVIRGLLLSAIRGGACNATWLLASGTGLQGAVAPVSFSLDHPVTLLQQQLPKQTQI